MSDDSKTIERLRAELGVHAPPSRRGTRAIATPEAHR
jgi:hypothetical protein